MAIVEAARLNCYLITKSQAFKDHIEKINFSFDWSK